jgi:hypothetical protein
MNWTNQKTGILVSFGFGIALLAVSFYLRHFGIMLIAFASLFCAFTVCFRRTRNFGVLLVASFISLAIADMGLPLFLDNGDTEYDLTSDYPKTHYFKMTDIGAQANEGVHRGVKQFSNGEPIYNVKYTIGKDGFRITPLSHDGKPRINFFGCSETFGEGLNDDETLPYFVRQQMGNISVKNFGFHGNGAHQALAILQSDRDTTGSINFFLTAPWHAPRSSCKPKWTTGSPKYQFSENGNVLKVGRCGLSDGPELLMKVLIHSNVYSVVRQIWDDSINDADFELYLAIVTEIGKISRARKQAFIIGFIKADEKFYKNSSYTNEKLFQKLKDVADEIVDVTLANKSEELDGRYFIRGDGHATGIANTDRAAILVDLFRRQLGNRTPNE